MVYHPMTTKGNAGSIPQGFNFEPAGDLHKTQQLSMQIQTNASPAPQGKRSTSVKHATQTQAQMF
jgi:hypothetical protein